MLKNDPGSHFSTGSLFNVTPVHNCCASKFLVMFLCRHVTFWIFCGCRGFCHRIVRSLPFNLEVRTGMLG